MSRYPLGALVTTLAAVLAASSAGLWAQTAPATPAPAPAAAQAKAADKAADKARTLNGCVSQDGATPAQFTLSETGTGDKYRLIGRGIGKYAGRRVEIVGGPDRRRITFKGGLLPSANVAAQAGALDPARAAIANQPGGGSAGTGGVPLPEFQVSRVRLLDGVCQETR